MDHISISLVMISHHMMKKSKARRAKTRLQAIHPPLFLGLKEVWDCYRRPNHLSSVVSSSLNIHIFLSYEELNRHSHPKSP